MISLGCVVSKKMNRITPYGGVYLQALTIEESKAQEKQTGSGIALNLGIMLSLAENQDVAIEWNTENQAFNDGKDRFTKAKIESSTWTISGLTLAYMYKF